MSHPLLVMPLPFRTVRSLRRRSKDNTGLNLQGPDVNRESREQISGQHRGVRRSPWMPPFPLPAACLPPPTALASSSLFPEGLSGDLPIPGPGGSAQRFSAHGLSPKGFSAYNVCVSVSIRCVFVCPYCAHAAGHCLRQGPSTCGLISL